MTHALIVNAYDAGNWGDAAIVEGLIDSLRAGGVERVTVAPVDWASGDARWLALGANEVVRPIVSLYDVPARMRRPRPLRLIHVLGRLGRFRLGQDADAGMRRYREADLIVSVGGGYLGGSSAGGNLIKCAAIRAGSMAGRSVIVAPITVNPPSGPVRAILRWGLSGATVFARDRPTQARLARDRIRAAIVPDIALRSSSLSAARANDAAIVGPSGPPIIGWAPRGYRADHAAWGRPATAELIVFDAVQETLRTTDARIRFFAHVRAGASDDDLVAVERLMDRFGPSDRGRIELAPRPDNLADVARGYAPLTTLIASRMHAAILAMAVGTPTLAIGYEPKVAGVLADLGLPERVVRVDRDVRATDIVSRLDGLARPGERERTLEAFDRAQGRFGQFDTAIAAALAGRRS